MSYARGFTLGLIARLSRADTQAKDDRLNLGFGTGSSLIAKQLSLVKNPDITLVPAGCLWIGGGTPKTES
jgi:hypothetical protein